MRAGRNGTLHTLNKFDSKILQWSVQGKDWPALIKTFRSHSLVNDSLVHMQPGRLVLFADMGGDLRGKDHSLAA